MSQAQGEIYDLGYQHYDGPRGGRFQAVWSLWINGFRTILGLGRGARAKILPVLMSLVVIAPSAVFLVMSAIVPIAQPASHAEFYEAISLLLLLFSAIIAPELLIPDRRNGVTTLYLVRPLTSFDYVLARWSAFLGVVLVLTLIAQVLVLIANLLLAEMPWDYLQENWLDIPRFVLAGVVITVFVTTIPLAVAAFTERRAYAAAFVIAAFVITTPMSALLSMEWCQWSTTYTVRNGEVSEGDSVEECGRITGDYAKWFTLLDVGRAPMHLINLMFDDAEDFDLVDDGVDAEDEAAALVTELPLAVPIAWYAFLVLGPGCLLLWRYRSMKI